MGHVAYESIADSQSAAAWLHKLHEIYQLPLKGSRIDTSFMGEVHFHGSTQIASGQLARQRSQKRKQYLVNRCYFKDLVDDKLDHDSVVEVTYRGLKPVAHLEAALGYKICEQIQGVSDYRPEV